MQTAFEIVDKDGTGNVDIKDLKVILRALGFEPQEDEIKKLLSTINRSDDEENLKKGYSSNTIDFEEFKKIMNNKLRESEEIEQLRIGFHSFADQSIKKDPHEPEYITLKSLREVANELREVINDEELKEMMVQANPDLKSLINEGKGDDNGKGTDEQINTEVAIQKYSSNISIIYLVILIVVYLCIVLQALSHRMV